jgi:hypothetical protein
MRAYFIVIGLIACTNIVQASDNHTSKSARIDLSSTNKSLTENRFDPFSQPRKNPIFVDQTRQWLANERYSTLPSREKAIFLNQITQLLASGYYATFPTREKITFLDQIRRLVANDHYLILPPTEKAMFVDQIRQLLENGNYRRPPAVSGAPTGIIPQPKQYSALFSKTYADSTQQNSAYAPQDQSYDDNESLISLQDDMARYPVKYSSSASVLTTTELDAIEIFRSRPEIALSSIFIQNRPREVFNTEYRRPAAVPVQTNTTSQNSAYAPQVRSHLPLKKQTSADDDDKDLCEAIERSLKNQSAADDDAENLRRALEISLQDK